ncbi:MAG: helix-turn-helix domain-containing protein [Candidatus Omnitrophica bacterium]|nr:helix-turn-helix domain-containing protein [Candidatus Omnitrophota bacterium]
MTIGQRIKQLREEKNWSQKELALKLGLKRPSAISAWETELNGPNPTQRQKLCDIFGISLNELYGITPPVYVKPDQRLIPVFDASCGKFIDWSDGSYPVGHYPENEPTNSKDANAFYVRAHGDSMTGRADDRRTIFDGDLLLVEPSKQINDGDLIFCRKDGKGVTVKKIKHSNNNIHLVPLNDKHDIITLSGKNECRCFKITEIKRKV